MQHALQQLMKITEFADFCGTTRDTLLWYDKLGILKPAETRENGYRYYSPRQYFEYSIISVLKQTGSSMQEIANYQQQFSQEHLHTLLEQRQQELDEQFRQLQQTRQLLHDMKQAVQEAQSCQIFQPELVELPAEGIVATTLSSTAQNSDQVLAQNISAHIQRYATVPGVHRYPFCIRLDGRDLGHCIPRDQAYFFRADWDVATAERPAGCYIRLYYRGYYAQLWDSIQKIYGFAQANGMQLYGDIYEYDILTDLLGSQEENYTCCLLFPVRPIPPAPGMEGP